MNQSLFRTLLAVAAMTSASTTLAADHIDAPAASSEPTADITDVFAWMTSDASALNLVMNVAPFSASDAQFSTDVTYAFHVNSSSGYGEAQTETLIRCRFYDTQQIECWAGDTEYVAGDPSTISGITSGSGDLRVFAGPRNDPFFMEFTGFTETVAAVVEAAPNLTFDDDGCPALDSATSNALVGQLQSGADGAPASDTFAGTNVLSLVIQVDTSVVNAGGGLLSIWGSTHR